MLPYVLNLIGNKDNAADINFWYLIKLKWLSFPMEKEQRFATDQVKNYGF